MTTSPRCRSGSWRIISPSTDAIPAWLRAVPFALTTLRVALAPVLLWIVRDGHAGPAYVAVVLAAFISDIFDGVIARRLGIATAWLRRYDSHADLVFYGTAAFTVWQLHSDAIRAVAVPFGVLVVLEVIRPAFDLRKFGRQAAYHAWSAKTWGVSVVVALVALMGFGVSFPFLPLAIVLGIAADLEGLLISAILPVWTHDVKSFAHALRIRRLHAAGAAVDSPS